MSALSRLMAWLGTGRPVAPAAPADANQVPPVGHPVDMWRGGVPREVFALSDAFEGFRPAPYRCAAGVWTIGFGSTRDWAGRPVGPATPPVTRRQAEEMAERDLARAASLASLAFPLGLPARWGAVAILTCNNMGDMRVWGPTLRRMLLAGEYRAAAAQLAAYRNAGGVPSLGLRRRRWAEAAYAMGMDAAQARDRAWAQIGTPDDWPGLP